MKERKQRLLSVVEILASVVRTIHLRRSFHTVSPAPALVMWRVIYGNLTDMAVLEWCKLFGSDDEQISLYIGKILHPILSSFGKTYFRDCVFTSQNGAPIGRR